MTGEIVTGNVVTGEVLTGEVEGGKGVRWRNINMLLTAQLGCNSRSHGRADWALNDLMVNWL